jgi:hypothetical protein
MASFYEDASLVVIPSGYKTSKIYAEKPTDGSGDLTFTRASGATRVASNGLIEKVRTNLLTYSNTFSNAAWLNDDSTETSGQTGYDGTTNAWLLSRTGANGRIGQVLSVSGSATFSIYVKAGTKSWVKLASSDAGVQAFFNLSTGAIGTAGAGTIAKITSAGNGYYRCSISGNASFSFFNVWIADADNDTTGATGTILIQDSQVETGDIATDYIPTTTAAVSVGPVSNVPRLDYLGSSCPRLLLEPQRTNLMPFSEQFDNAAWTNASTTITANYGVSPDGYTNADRFQQTTVGALQRTLTVTASTAYTVSFYCKLLGGTSASLGVYNLSAGNFIFQDNLFSSLVLNQWVRVTRTFTTPVGCTSITGELWRDSTIDCLVYGFQMEAGAYATSYIPTTSAAVTRVADAASKTGISSLIGQTEGTLFGEFTFTGVTPLMHLFCSVAGSYANAIYVQTFSSTGISMQVWSGAVNQVGIDVSGLSVGQNIKFAAAYKNNDFVFYVNGTQAGSDTSGTVPSGLSQIEVGGYSEAGSPFIWSSSTKQALLFKTRLTNSQLSELTSL